MLTLAFLFISQSVMAQESPLDTLWKALQEDDVTSVVAQIESGTSANSATCAETALSYAIKRDSLEMVIALLAHGANPDLAQPVSGFTPLMVAVKHGNMEAMKLLIAQKANVNLSSVFGRNPLHVAAFYNSIEMAHLLLTETNVDVNARGMLCPLAVASRQDYLEFVKLILKESKVAPSEKCLNSAKNMATYNKNTDVLAVLNVFK